MFEKIVLCASMHHVTAGIWRRKKLMSCEMFDDDETGRHDFRRFLERNRDMPVHLIVDTVEEDFHHESLPQVSGRERREMLARKLGQHYRETPYRAAEFIAPRLDGPRDRYLFMALKNADVIAPWIQIIRLAEAPLAGMYLLPAVSRVVVESLGFEASDLLLVTRQHASLRQSYFADGGLQLSRIMLRQGLDEGRLQSLLRREVEKTLLYLANEQQAPRLHLVLAADVPVENAWLQQVAQPQVDYEVLENSSLARRLGLSEDLLSRHPELLHMHALACRESKAQLAPNEILRQEKLRKLCLGFNAASAACLAASVVMTALNWLNTAELTRQTARLEAELAVWQRAHVDASASPQSPPPSALKHAVEVGTRLEHLSHTPERLMQVLGEALDEHADIQLERLRWELAANADIEDVVTAPVALSTQAWPYEIGFVTAKINASEDYRTALAGMDQLVHALAQHPKVERVQVLHSPDGMNPNLPLHGTVSEAVRLPPQFELKLVLKRGPMQ